MSEAPQAEALVLEGQGLHSGAPARVRLRRARGPVTLVQGAATARLDALVPVPSERSTAVASRDGALRLATVEHLFAALAGLRLREGLAVHVDGPEVPLLDGGARAFADALLATGAPPSPHGPGLRVAREGTVEVGASRYAFAPAEGVRVLVHVDFDDARLAHEASWDGDEEDFRERIAPARTFGFEREVAELAARGLASHVSPESVVVIGGTRVLSAGRPFTEDEPARHKLLDLLGDLYLHGGPPRGLVRATRPGHAATHRAVAEALAGGLLVRVGR